ncbi:MAG: hypothetical protein R3E75_12110 [Steroidobacteraceae bacterium]
MSDSSRAGSSPSTAIRPSSADPSSTAAPAPAEPRLLAAREFAGWLAAPLRSSVALRVHGDRSAVQRVLNIRLDGVLSHDRPASANRRWLCEIIRAWAPLEVIFPTRDYSNVPGVSGELPRHAALLVERAYGHVLAATRSIPSACDLLRADAQLLDLQIAVATALQPQLTPTSSRNDWPEELLRMSLGMAEFLHRHAIGLAPMLSDETVMTYTSYIARLQRSFDDECRKARVA